MPLLVDASMNASPIHQSPPLSGVCSLVTSEVEDSVQCNSSHWRACGQDLPMEEWMRAAPQTSDMYVDHAVPGVVHLSVASPVYCTVFDVCEG